MNSNSRNWIKVSGILGIVTPIVAWGCIFSSIALATSFSWTQNALSDLGVMPEPVSVVFNSGLFVSGILASLFAAVLLADFSKNILGRLGAIVLFFSTVALTAIGIFPENMRPMHFFASATFFALFPVSLLLFALSYFRLKKPTECWFSLIIFVLAALVWLLEFWFQYAPGVAIPEALSAAAGSLWTIVTGFELARRSRSSDQ